MERLNQLLPFTVERRHVAIGASALLFLRALQLRRRSRAEIGGDESKVVLVTGCDSGFGERVADEAEKRGFSVVAACYTASGAAKFEGRAKVRTVVADLTQEAGIGAVVAAVRQEVSREGRQFWAVVNNAGQVLPGNVEWIPLSQYTKTFDLNFFAPVSLVYELFPLLRDSLRVCRRSKSVANPRVINMSSIHGVIAQQGLGTYAASKAALEAYSRVLRLEMAPWGLHVTCVEPSMMRTPMFEAFMDAWMKGYKAAPEERRKEYGDAWAEEYFQVVKGVWEIQAADPMMTVRAVSRLLVQVHPPSRLPVGNWAWFMWVPLSWMPTGMADAIMANWMPPLKNQPLSLVAQ